MTRSGYDMRVYHFHWAEDITLYLRKKRKEEERDRERGERQYVSGSA